MEIFDDFNKVINEDMNDHLEKEFTAEEVKIALDQMHPCKLPV